MTSGMGPGPRALGDAERIRLIVKVMHECDEEPTLEAVAAQFKHETGRDLPEVWQRTPPPWLQQRGGWAAGGSEDAGSPSSLVGRED